MTLPKDSHGRGYAGGGQGSEGVFDRAAALEWVGGDVALLAELRDLLLTECGGHLRDIREAVAHRDADALERAAHALKGSVGNFSAKPAADAALRLEVMGREGNLAEAEAAFAVLEKEIERLKSALVGLEGDPTA